jgi:hypothetical protein
MFPFGSNLPESLVMYTDPQTVTVNTVAKSLARTESGDHHGAFESTADGLVLSVSHALARRNRSTVRLDVSKTSADPLVPSTNRPYSMSCYLVVDVPPQGFSTAEITNNAKALIDWLAIAGNQTKLVNHES